MAFDNKISTREQDYSQWYLDVIQAADLADYAPVKGCMVIKPNGYAIWENIQKVLDSKFKETGVKNAYFPLLIPQSFLEKEAKHVEGFAPECAVVTHAGGKELEEPYVIRPTSETIIYDMFSKWVKSYRDLPLLINQWANIVRWEMRTRLFLRTSEFLWQEGHTVHATVEEANDRALQMNKVYRDFVEDYLAIPVISGEKSESERFAGADHTYTIEAMMQDGKALQSGTSHLLAESFTQSFGVKYLDSDGAEKNARATSWGVSTRMIGGLIMVHSDDKGLVLPPKIAPVQVAIITIWKDEEEHKKTLSTAQKLCEELQKQGISAEIDDREMRPGPKFFECERKGIPLRIDLGSREVESGETNLLRRDNDEKSVCRIADITSTVPALLQQIQESLFNRAKKFRNDLTQDVANYDELKAQVARGFAVAHWCGDAECERKINEETKATIRCIPFEQNAANGKCVFCGNDSSQKVVFARSY